MADSYIIAIDFGTSYSGYAYSLTPRWKKIEPEVKLWGQKYGLETLKTPTCILFNKDEKFLKFGYDAKTAYIKMRGQEASKHYFFENFKMSLYNTELNRDVKVRAVNGKEMKAMKVISESLSYLKEDALKTISRNTSGRKFIASDFTWVLTVPAIWDPSAKQFMREAATQATIVTEETEEKLIIALEPEAASVWCKRLPPEGFITQNHGGTTLEQIPGTQYIVVDCGGGTIDFTVHEVMDGGGLKELHKAPGNNLGGQTVDRSFKEFLREIFSNGVWDEYEKKFPSELQKLMNDINILKQTDEDVQFCCPLNLGSLAQKRQQIENYFESVQGASWDDGWIQISKEKVKSLFDESLNGITENLCDILEKDLNIKFIVLVGGFAGNHILQQHIKDQFGHQCKVMCPHRPQQAVMKGAVMFGRNTTVVVSRKSVFTYGVATVEPFDESKHKVEKKLLSGGDYWCCDIFKKLIGVDEDVGQNETREHTFNPVEAYQKKVNLRFYRSERKKPTYVDEWGVEKVGSFTIDLPDNTAGRNQKIKLEMRFGSTEITATGFDTVSGSKASIKIDLMTK